MRQCDKCHKDTDNQTVTITLGAQTRVLVLCDTHLRPVVTLFNIGNAEPVVAPSLNRPKGHAVIPID